MNSAPLNGLLERFSDIETYPHLSRSAWQTTKVTKLAVFCRQRFNSFQKKIQLGKDEKLRRNFVLYFSVLCYKSVAMFRGAEYCFGCKTSVI
jgi:hypothetical protein